MTESRRVVVSGIGAVTAFGVGIEKFWNEVRAGKSAAAPITQFEADFLPTRFAAPVPLTDTELAANLVNQRAARTLNRAGKMAMIAAAEASREARLADGKTDLHPL